MGKGGGGSSTTNTVQKADPWVGAQPYLYDIMEQSKNLYNTQGAIQPYSGTSIATLPDWLKTSILSGIGTSASQAPDIQQLMYGSLANALNPQATQYSLANALQVDPSALNVQGATIEGSGINANPAINYALYGNGMSPYLDTMASDIVNRTMQTGRDTATDMYRQLQESILPQISNDFQAAGSLGASRQGLLQGQAVGLTNDALAREYGDLMQNMTGQLGNLYGGIYENAQNRSASLASQLAGLGSNERLAQAGLLQQAMLANQGVDLQALLANQGADLQAQLANQGAGLTASSQDIQKLLAQLQAGQLLPGINEYPMQLSTAMLGAYAPLLSEQQSLYDLARSNYYESAMAPYEALLRYAGITAPQGSMGSSSTGSSTQPTYGNSLSQNLGTLGLLAMMFGAFSDRRLKRDIERIGTTPGLGLPVYRFRYVWGGPEHIGVMADEVKNIKPEAVGNVAGFDTVNYAMIY